LRILVVGAGATGGYFGARLAQAGRDVSFLVRPQRAAQLRAHGLEVISPLGNVSLRPRIVSADIDGHYDAILLTVKAFGLDTALNDIAPAVGPCTMILPVLNGMRHLDVIAARFGTPVVLGCVCMIVSSLDDAGRVVQMTPLHKLAYGELAGLSTPRIEALDRVMQGAGFDARLSISIQREMWEKWVLLAALGGITCLMRGNIGAVASAPYGREFAAAFLQEVTRVVVASGQHPGTEFLKTALATVTNAESTLTSSMYRDLVAGRPVEADQILGDLLTRATRLGIEAPLIAAAYTHLSVYMNQHASHPANK
jgi:2-dehydropantoate 2-reductase